ncbi:secretion protein HlyD [Opitutaceae bacterium EW11]|nr:secretion protein HlyD [Opitutaceae bacterium EW11]
MSSSTALPEPPAPSSTPAPAAPPAHTHHARAEPPGPHSRGKAKQGKSSLPRRVALGVVAAGFLGWGTHFVLHSYRYESTDDAYVTGHLHRISAQVSAPVKEVRVEDNQVVAAGDVLVVLDPAEFQIAVEKARAAEAQVIAQSAQADAAVGQAEAQAAGAEAREAQAESQLKQINAQLELARLTQARTEQLFRNNTGASTQADVDAARSAYDAASASAAAAAANIAALKAGVTSAHASLDAARAQAAAAKASIATARAALRNAELDLSYTTIKAPVAGRIGNKSVETGNRVQAGQALFAIASNDAWVVANFKETQLARMHAGEPVELSIDALPGETLHGHIDSLAPASGAQFALLPPDNATGNFNKVVQRVPVKIVFDPADVARIGDRLRLGLSAIVDVRIR